MSWKMSYQMLRCLKEVERKEKEIRKEKLSKQPGVDIYSKYRMTRSRKSHSTGHKVVKKEEKEGGGETVIT